MASTNYNPMAEIEPLALSAANKVGRARAGRKLGMALLVMMMLLPVVLAFVPWQQNVPGTGYVSALDPLDRIQTIPAPVTGRLVELNVQEGSRVRKGDILAEMRDLAQGLQTTLAQQLEFARKELELAHSQLESIDNQIFQLIDERDFAVKTATSELNVAMEAVRAERERLVGLQADREQKEKDKDRKQRLFDGGAKSELAAQEAVAAYELAKSKVNASNAKIDELLNKEKARSADIDRIRANMQAKIDSADAKKREAEQKLQKVKTDVTNAEIAVEFQSNQTITAPRDGVIFRVLGAATSDLIGQNEPLFEFVPDVDQLAVEFWVRGIDAPMVSPGRKTRLIFEGWPAVQVAGWPSVAVGTFGGIVQLSDAQARADGRVRVLVTPDPEDDAWPKQPFLRQGVRVTGWVQLETVSTGYEIWRQLNAFPPSITQPEEATDSGAASMAKKGKDGSK